MHYHGRQHCQLQAPTSCTQLGARFLYTAPQGPQSKKHKNRSHRTENLFGRDCRNSITAADFGFIDFVGTALPQHLHRHTEKQLHCRPRGCHQPKLPGSTKCCKGHPYTLLFHSRPTSTGTITTVTTTIKTTPRTATTVADTSTYNTGTNSNIEPTIFLEGVHCKASQTQPMGPRDNKIAVERRHKVLGAPPPQIHVWINPGYIWKKAHRAVADPPRRYGVQNWLTIGSQFCTPWDLESEKEIGTSILAARTAPLSPHETPPDGLPKPSPQLSMYLLSHGLPPKPIQQTREICHQKHNKIQQ